MLKIIWLDSAVNDLVRLRKFLSETNPKAANKAAKLIKNATTKLQEFPLVGRPVEDLEDFYDLFIEFGVSGYHLRYKVYLDRVYIIHIKHMKELSFLGEREDYFVALDRLEQSNDRVSLKDIEKE